MLLLRDGPFPQLLRERTGLPWHMRIQCLVRTSGSRICDPPLSVNFKALNVDC